MNEMRKLMEAVESAQGGRRVAESQPDPTVAEQKLDDLKIEFAQTLMAISGFYSSDDPHSMFRNEMEQFEADVSELLDKMGFFNDI